LGADALTDVAGELEGLGHAGAPAAALAATARRLEAAWRMTRDQLEAAVGRTDRPAPQPTSGRG
jgi:hypothetical protein